MRSSRRRRRSADASCQSSGATTSERSFLRSYRVIYRVAGEDIRILTVFEGHRRLRLDEIEEE
ncbi:hypothetical protein BE18_13205 [Sorangium cellulosum]|uniref:Type II toxin-antitoxin system RelE/ParE family toxin n=1 Tax=Sorangium cellulosum TaxID=56 RepID=A0A150RC79_SORCE|nr:hypothetical protein BE18_13205 [Sorangium cellulosum]